MTSCKVINANTSISFVNKKGTTDPINPADPVIRTLIYSCNIFQSKFLIDSKMKKGTIFFNYRYTSIILICKSQSLYPKSQCFNNSNLI